MFKIGDIATVTEEIFRRDRKNVLYPGDLVEITRASESEHYTIVDIRPLNGSKSMVDVCCDEKGPLKIGPEGWTNEHHP
jgi:hypothetical protein